MRKLIVATIIGIFVIYCYCVYLNQNYYNVPHYKVKDIDILAGASQVQWNSEVWSAKRYNRLSQLENKKLYLVASMTIAGKKLDTRTVLKAADFVALVAQEGKTRLKVRDPGAVLKFSERNLRLRQSVQNPDSGEIIAATGERVNKETLDHILAAGIKRIAVVGKGDVVGFNATLFMVILIFIGMSLALEEIFWQPMMALVDARKKELHQGSECMRSNKAQSAEIEAERRKKMKEVYSVYQQTMRAARREALTETEGIMREMRSEMAKMRGKSESELKESIGRVEVELKQELPQLVDSLVKKATGKDVTA